MPSEKYTNADELKHQIILGGSAYYHGLMIEACKKSDLFEIWWIHWHPTKYHYYIDMCGYGRNIIILTYVVKAGLQRQRTVRWKLRRFGQSSMRLTDLIVHRWYSAWRLHVNASIIILMPFTSSPQNDCVINLEAIFPTNRKSILIVLPLWDLFLQVGLIIIWW